MNDAEQIMAMVWGRILGEVRKMRDDKYTLERIGSTLGVAKPTVQRWLENGAGGEKTAFIDVLRYLKALDIDLKELLYGDDKDAAELVPLADLEQANTDKERLTGELLEVQKELLQSQQKIISLQENIIRLEKLNAEIAGKARKAIIAVTARANNSEPVVITPAPERKKRLDPSCFPDLPPIHLDQE